MQVAYLTSAYLAPVQYYQHMVSIPKIIIEHHDNYVKQTYRNRCYIAGAEGIQSLTIPIVKPQTSKANIRDIEISNHGNWQHLHWNAIQSAYSNTAYFEFYKDYFIPFYENNERFLFDFNIKLQEIITDLLDLDIEYMLTDRYKEDFDTNEIDLREIIHPKKDYKLYDKQFVSKPYYQVFDDRHGFIANLSILDLLFNKGPESIFYLDRTYL